MPDDDDTVFYSPVLRIPDHCGGCRACTHACPAHAIKISVTGAEVDREACLGVIEKSGEDCFDCLLACRHNVLKLEKFRKKSDGSIEKA